MTNWGLAGGGGFQNALATGLQLGGQMAARRDRNALLELQARKQDLAEQKHTATVQKEADTARLTQDALAGKEGALDQLATVNFPRWQKVNDQQKAAALEESKIFGGAALDLLQVPHEQRRGRFIEYAQQFPQFADEINKVAFLPPEQQETALRGAVIEAQMVGKLHQMEQPRYQAIPAGGTLVNTKDPSAVNQFQTEVGAAPQGAVIQVQTPQQAAGLPPGTRYVNPDGMEYIR